MAANPAEATPGIRDLLSSAVSGISGAERPGQVTMAEAVWEAMRTGEHLAVQAGTGTGKSLAYLVPSALFAAAGGGGAVVISTATIALQRQLVDRDLPRLAKTMRKPLGRAPEFAILKGRRNYLCLAKTGEMPEDDGQDALFEPTSLTGRQVKRLHEWANETDTGDRDEVVPGVSEQAWRQVSVSARECVGAGKCPFGPQCFAEKAKRKAGESDIVVTNHALLAIDAISEGVLPEHQVVVVDEAHELVDRVTAVATGELSGLTVDMAARRCARVLGAGGTQNLNSAGNALATMLLAAPSGRMDSIGEALAASLAALRDAAVECASALRAAGREEREGSAGQAAEAALEELHENADRVLDAFGPGLAERDEVVWIEQPEDGQPSLHVAPLEVSELLAGELFSDRTVILTSATLTLGGSFEPLAKQWGLAGEPNWSAIDVGSPFDHPKSGILYVAKHLPEPGREGLSDEYLQEMWELIKAAGGRTLGLFSSMRAAKQATAALRDSLTYPLLCQGDDSTGQLVKQFSESEETCLFGTLSLWQGVDVPGRSLSLVIIDRIPFPRPDDPLASARTRAAGARGGNGFMEVSATQAALLLAQGSGRLLRSVSDRGVVAVLDPRLATKRYGDYLRASLPPFWTTTDPEVVRAALRRLTAEK
ncbi:MAG: ATP-dependent DNA helicase [Streptosporangiaceae bacterium]